MKSMKRNGMILAMSLLILLFCTTGIFAATPEAEAIGVQYRGHVQNKGDMPQPVGTMVKGPDALGTRGESLRVEGFWIELTGDVPEGAAIKYQVHVQNEGWMTPEVNGVFAGTHGKSQRVESIRISLENLPGYDVYYRGHVQNVGDVPQANGDWGWKKNGEELGTTGSSLRLEELQIKVVKQSDVTYDKAGTYGPKTGEEVVHTNVVINTPDVTLQNMHITGDLTIGEGVGEGDVTLNNITVDGDTFIRGGGKNSIHINGGDYNKITVQQTSSGQVRIVATDATGLEVVISEDAGGEDIILEGAFENVQVDAPDVKISTQGDTKIGEFKLAEGATGTQLTLDSKTTVDKLVLDAKADVKGQGTVKEADVNKDGVTFEKAPDKQNVAPEVETPPVVTPPEEKPPVTPPVTPPVSPSPGGGVGVAVTSVTVDKATLQLNAGGATENITATINPSNASSKNVTWTTSNQNVATVNNGVVTPVAAGTATITVTSAADSSKKATTVVTVKAAISATPIAANAPIPSTVISLTGDTFSQGADNIDNWTINSGTTGLTVSSIVLHGTAGAATSATVNFTGTAVIGTFEMTPKAAALTSNITGNKATITVTDQPLVKSTTPTTDSAVIAKTAQTQASVNFTLTSTHLAGAWAVYTNAACTTEATGVTASLSGSTLTLTHASNLPAATYYVVYNDGTRTDSDALALTVLASSEEPTAVSAVTAPTLVASNGDLQINFDEPSDLTGIYRIQMLVSGDGGQNWETAATAAVSEDPYFSSDMLSLSLTRISYRLEGMTTINKIKVVSIAQDGYLNSTFEMPCSLTINKAAEALPIVATYNNGTVQATMSAAKQEGETYFCQLKRANGTLITEYMLGEPNWIDSTTAEFKNTYAPYPADARIQLVKGSGATVTNNSTGSVNVTPLQAGGVPFTDITPVKSTTPTADTTTVAKTTQPQTSVGFTLTSSHTDGTWKVYSDDTCTTEATGVSATFSGNTVTLVHEIDLPAAIYYVVYNDETNTDSDALSLTVGAYEENLVDVVKNARFEVLNGTSILYFDQPTDKTGIQNYQIMFSSDNGQTWDYTAQPAITNETTISLDMSSVAINLNETKAFDKVKVISDVADNSGFGQNETSFAIDFTLTKAGSELAIAVARNELNNVEITLPQNATDDEIYAVRIFGSSGVGPSSTVTFKGSQITDNIITMFHTTQPISGISEGAIFKVCKINNCTTTGLSVTPMQATGVTIKPYLIEWADTAFTTIPADNDNPPYQLMQINYKRNEAVTSSQMTISMKTPADGDVSADSILWKSAGGTSQTDSAFWQWSYRDASSVFDGNGTLDTTTQQDLDSIERSNDHQLKAGSVVTVRIDVVKDAKTYSITKDYTITADDVTNSTYNSTPPTLSSEKAITATTVGTLTGGNITGVPGGTKVSALKAGLTVSDDATVEILTGADGSAVADQANADVTADMKIQVTAEDGSKTEYSITLEAGSSDAKTITATTVGTLTSGNITAVPVGTKVSALKAGLTVSDQATVEILTGTGGTAVDDQTNTDVTPDMKIEVTAQDNSKAEYTIAMGAVGIASNPQITIVSESDTFIKYDAPTNMAGISAFEIMFSKDAGTNWENKRTVIVDQFFTEWSLQAYMSVASGYVNETTTYNKMKVISKAKAGYQQSENPMDLNYTITKTGEALAITATRNAEGKVEIKLPAEKTTNETYIYQVLNAEGSIIRSDLISVSAAMYWSTNDTIVLPNVIVPSNDSLIKMSRITGGTETGLNATPLQTNGVSIAEAPSLSDAKIITATTVGTLTSGNITGVPSGTKVDVLKAGLTVSDDATVEIITGAGGSAVANQADTDVTADMKIQVTAEDNSQAEYTIAMAPLLSQAKAITATTVGTLSSGNITLVPGGTKVNVLKAGLTVSDAATAEILAGAGGSVVADQENTDVTADMKIQVTAEDGSKAEYSITMAPVLSSEKVIISTIYGTLTEGNIIGFPAAVKVSSFKDSLTVSQHATVEILSSAGGSPVADQENTAVAAGMIIQVTAQDGSKAEYTITMAPTLDAPTNLVAEAGSSLITLTWDAAPNAQSYSIYRSTTSGSDYIEIASGVASTSCQAVNLTPGQTYYFVIKAVAAGYNDSTESSEVSAIANVDLSGSSYSGNKLIVTNESLSLTTQSTGTLNNITIDSEIIEGLEEDSYRINPEIPVTQSPDQPLVNSSMESNMVVANVDDERSFYTYNYQTQQYETITGRCAYVGTHSEIWVDKNEAVETTLTAEEAQTIGTEFDQNIYDLITTNFYAAPDVNNDSKVAILVYDIKDGYSGPGGGYVGGYFNGNDLYNVANSNQLDMFYVDTNPLIGTEKNLSNSYSTMAHEFQHMVNYNCNKDQGGQMDTWLNEALSLAAEHLYEGVQSSRISYYNNSTAIADGRSVMDWNNSDSLPNYALSYLFSQYLRTQAEAKLAEGVKTDIYKQIIVDPGNANTALTNAIKTNIDTDMTTEKFMTNFRVAMVLKANSGVYSFGKDAASFSGITTKLNTQTSADLKGGGAIVKGISGSFTAPEEHGANISYTGVY